ncbi:ATP-binding cassette domain-containing protein [Lysinibacillus alkalisoli]|uniref:ATP-binding cassette domain-containing protein n=1 Tax=Lysinibacillus alkalisoli TaxID=1911548 RepID=UPI0016695DF7|nr:ATP-binding cassette domain-containing protein [Lysinibacillus alkalisoli]
MQKATKLAKDFDLEDVLYQKVKHISGGQKQRTAIIRSLILNPAIILADEPTTNLDADNFALVLTLFQSLKQEGKIIIIATHDERIVPIQIKYTVLKIVN